MKKFNYGITEIYLENIKIEERIPLYKKVGFDFLSIDWGEDLQDNLYQIRLAKECGLKIDDLHLDYKNANDIWLYPENSYKDYIKKSIDDISKIEGIGKNVIIHISKSDNPPTFSLLGAKTFMELNYYAKQKGVTLCFENLKRPDYLKKLITLSKKDFIENGVDINKNIIGLKNFKICLDVGHANLYMNDYFDFIKEFKNNIITTHLHDNSGKEDSHLSLYSGNINWPKTISTIKKTSAKSLHLEIFPSSISLTKEQFEQYLYDNLTALKNLKKQRNVKF